LLGQRLERAAERCAQTPQIDARDQVEIGRHRRSRLIQ
jgi:hypothetical protein